MKTPGFCRLCVTLAALVAMLALQGCATVSRPDPRDPLESFNRTVFGFNDAVDAAVLKPVAKGYKAISPDWFRRGVSNFFNNLDDVWSALNNGLQGRGQAFGDSVGRVMVNTSLGILGFIDVASELNIERRSADFGQTLGKWGVPPGPYVILPVMGPYTLREVAAIPVDSNELKYTIGDKDAHVILPVVSVIDQRTKYLGAGDVLEGASLDAYSFQRDAYLQRQRNIQFDGNPPEEPETEP